MTKWRKIETEGLPPKGKTEYLWWNRKGYYRIGKLEDFCVEWEDRWAPIIAFTHWAPLLPPPPKE